MQKAIKSIGTALLILFLFFAGAHLVDRWAAQEGKKMLHRTLTDAAAHCYASEGRYPPDLGYLRRYYGIRTDHRRYTVSYRCTAPDLAPEIHVSDKKGGAMA